MDFKKSDRIAVKSKDESKDSPKLGTPKLKKKSKFGEAARDESPAPTPKLGRKKKTKEEPKEEPAGKKFV